MWALYLYSHPVPKGFARFASFSLYEFTEKAEGRMSIVYNGDYNVNIFICLHKPMRADTSKYNTLWPHAKTTQSGCLTLLPCLYTISSILNASHRMTIYTTAVFPLWFLISIFICHAVYPRSNSCYDAHSSWSIPNGLLSLLFVCHT